MFTKTVYRTMLTTLLVSISTLTFSLYPAAGGWEATETIYIRADGSVDPPDAPISSVDNVFYYITDDIEFHGSPIIVVERSDIIVDGDGHDLRSGDGISFGLSSVNNVTIQNVDCEGGIRLSSSSNNTIFDNNILGSVSLSSSSNNIIFDNIIRGGREIGNCIMLSLSSNNTISENSVISWLTSGIVLASSSDNTITRNNIGPIPGGAGIMLSSSFNNIISENNITDCMYELAGSEGIFLSASFSNTRARPAFSLAELGKCDHGQLIEQVHKPSFPKF